VLKKFSSFLTTSNALALAIGVIIGAAVGKVVASLVDDMIMPVVGMLLPAGDWREAKIVLKTATDASGKITENAIRYGNFMGTLLEFLIIAFVVFLIARALLKPAAAKQCPECRESIPVDARRCRACATPL
jgi:large conductance mechanosensitive channel